MNKKIVLTWYSIVILTFLIFLIIIIEQISKSAVYLLVFFIILTAEIMAITRFIELIKINPNIEGYKIILRKKDEEIEKLKNHNDFLIKSALTRSRKYEELSKYTSSLEMRNDKIRQELEKIKKTEV